MSTETEATTAAETLIRTLMSNMISTLQLLAVQISASKSYGLDVDIKLTQRGSDETFLAISAKDGVATNNLSELAMKTGIATSSVKA